MLKSNFILLIYFFVPFIMAFSDNTKSLIQEYLLETYSNDHPELVTGYVYNINTPIYEIKSKIINTQGVKIYKTSIWTGLEGYSRLSIGLSINKEQSIQEIYSPTFSDKQKDFIEQFIGFSVNSKLEEKRLVKELGNILSEITYDGKINNVQNVNNTWKLELWHGHLKWRIIEFEFDDGTLKSIEIFNPKKRD